jgi:anhydro-N-acetylmuramic acid kinase
MSGTSLDGVDVAHIQFRIKITKWTFHVIKNETIPYNSTWINTLKTAVDFSETELEELNHEYTSLLASIISSFITRHKIQNIQAVCSHGHTILHQPIKGITLQIGNLPILSDLLGQTVVCDFRVQDVLLGGQGAPLV